MGSRSIVSITLLLSSVVLVLAGLAAYRASLVLLDDDLKVRATWIDGTEAPGDSAR